MTETSLKNQTSTLREKIVLHPMFIWLNETEKKTLLLLAAEHQFAANSYLFKFNEPTETFHIITSGQVLLESYLPNRGIVPIQTLRPNEIVGWSWLTAPYRWQFSARALEDTTTLGFNTREVRDLMERDHNLGYSLYKYFFHVVAERMQAARLQLINLYPTTHE